VPAPIDQVTVNEYTPGVGIAPHIDTHSAFGGGAILSLSLAGATVMELRRRGDHRPLLLPRRSLLVLGGEARYAWSHYIAARKTDVIGGVVVPRPDRRVSLTLRQVRPRGEACACAWPDECDSQSPGALPPTRAQLAAAAVAAAAAAAAGAVTT